MMTLMVVQFNYKKNIEVISYFGVKRLASTVKPIFDSSFC